MVYIILYTCFNNNNDNYNFKINNMVAFNIIENTPIKNFIRQEIINIWSLSKYNDIGIGVSTIDNTPICSNELYGLHFNSNNNNVLCINVAVFIEPKSTKSPQILIKGNSGYNFYKSSTSCTIKLKTFL